MIPRPNSSWLTTLAAVAALLAWPAPSVAESARLRDQPTERRGPPRVEDRGPREHTPPPKLRSPRERPAPDAHRPPRHRDDGERDDHRRPRWDHRDDDDRRWHGGRPPSWHDDHRHRQWTPAPRYHDHRHRHGRHVHSLGPRAYLSLHFGQRYWFDDGYWYTPAPSSGYVVVRPPAGVYLHALPAYYTLVSVGPNVYYYANGVYYSAAPSGGYQVVEAPDGAPPPYEPPMVYPARGQSPEQQSTDEYECHQWAVDRAGFDPTLSALGQGPEGDEVLRGNYRRALTACLEGRGYTVK